VERICRQALCAYSYNVSTQTLCSNLRLYETHIGRWKAPSDISRHCFEPRSLRLGIHTPKWEQRGRHQEVLADISTQCGMIAVFELHEVCESTCSGSHLFWFHKDLFLRTVAKSCRALDRKWQHHAEPFAFDFWVYWGIAFTLWKNDGPRAAPTETNNDTSTEDLSGLVLDDVIRKPGNGLKHLGSDTSTHITIFQECCRAVGVGRVCSKVCLPLCVVVAARGLMVAVPPWLAITIWMPHASGYDFPFTRFFAHWVWLWSTCESVAHALRSEQPSRSKDHRHMDASWDDFLHPWKMNI